MKKRMTGSAIFIVVLAVGAAAQTNTFPTSGSVGIGTTSPGYLLDVDGSARIAGDLYFGNLGDPASIAPTWTDNFHTGMNFNYVNAGTPGVGIALAYTGNVGIGTPNPLYTLDVTGTARVATALYFGSLSDPASIAPTWTDNFHTGMNFNYVNAGTPGVGIALAYTGNVGIGTTAPAYNLDVTGTVHATGLINATTSGVKYPDGNTQVTAWTGVLCGGDYAEAVNAKASVKAYEPGDVLVIGDGAGGEVQKSVEPYSTMVAGIFATKPGVIGRRQTLLKDQDEIPMAMVGIVPTKVTAENGPIRRGDLLVTSSSIGYAMKGTDRTRLVGAVIGKAMGSLDTGTGVIEVLVTLQ